MSASIKFSRVNHNVHPKVVIEEAKRIIDSVPNSIGLVKGQLTATKKSLIDKEALKNHVCEFGENNLVIRLDDKNQKFEGYKFVFNGALPERLVFGILYPNKVNIEDVKNFALRCVGRSFYGTIEFFTNKENYFCSLYVRPLYSEIEVVFNVDDGKEAPCQFIDTFKVCQDIGLVRAES